jgi:hypothetical protein
MFENAAPISAETDWMVNFEYCAFLGFTIWLFNSSPWKDPPFLIGKPSISMGHGFHGYVK